MKQLLCIVLLVGVGVLCLPAQNLVNEGQLVIDNAGSLVVPGNAVNDGGTLTNNGSLDIAGNLSGINGGSFSSGSGSEMVFNGGGSQNLSGVNSLETLVVESGSEVVLGSGLSLISGLTLTSGTVNLNGNTLTLGTSAGISGTPGNSNHVRATSGNLTKEYSGTGSFTFPVGDGTNYSPISLNFTSGSFASGSATVSLTAGKHPNNSSTTDYLNRYWTVSSSGITAFSCNVTATYANGDIQGTESALHGGQWNGSSWTDLGAVTAGSNQLTGTVSSFSDFTGGEPTAFPVELLRFKADAMEQTVELRWTTASEQNADYFAIERSQAQHSWTEIGQTPASGNTQTLRDYQFTDSHPLSDQSYYRLRQVDLDGSYRYSEVRSVNFTDPGILVYPNPVQNVLYLDLPAGTWKAELFDNLGRSLLQEKEVGSQLDLRSFPDGTYLLRLTSEEGRQWSGTVVK